jgi:hypothetical protein
MFSRGNWAIIGVNPESLHYFRSGLDNIALMVPTSQLVRSLITQHNMCDTYGINPFSQPRLDEEVEVDIQTAVDLVKFATLDHEERSALVANAETSGIYRLLDAIDSGFALGASSFTLGDSALFGFWFISNTYKDVSHKASIQEQAAYTTFGRPAKFLSPEDKKVVDASVWPGEAAIRKQIPFLINFREGRVYIESTSKADIMAVAEWLSVMGAETSGLGWKFDTEGHWPSKVLNRFFSETSHKDAFAKRSEDAVRFRPSEIEELEDSELQRIVTKHYSTTDVGGGKWVSLSAPAQVALTATSAPIVVGSPTNTTTLLGITDGACLHASSVTLQERITMTKKDGSERSFRKDLVSFEINDSLNIVEVGAACLRGFDLPTFKKDIVRDIKKTKKVPSIEEFWRYWLLEMADGVRFIESELIEALYLNATRDSQGIQPLSFRGGDDDSDVVIEPIAPPGNNGFTFSVEDALGSEAGE